MLRISKLCNVNYLAAKFPFTVTVNQTTEI